MTRLHLEDGENYAKANSALLLSKIQNVISTEIQKSSILMRDNVTLLPEDVIVPVKDNDSDFSDDDKPRPVQRPNSATTTMATTPEFDIKEIITGHVLGRGGFCSVSELNEIRLIKNRGKKNNASSGGTIGTENSKSTKKSFFSHRHNRHANQGGNSPREHLARRVWSKKGNRYVVKQVDTSFLTSSQTESNVNMHNRKVQLMRATIDIVLEAKYLSSLSHPHIISVVGIITSSGLDNASTTGSTIHHNTHVSSSNSVKSNGSAISVMNHYNLLRYGIIFEKLPIMLTSRLNDWMQEQRRTTGVTGFFCRKKNQRIADLLRERLFVAHDIAEAMDYLHSENIIYRDLKPDNVGFDSDGILKVFDFGLVKELREEDRDELGLYRNMTGLTGGIRYMAPEVGLNQPYNLKADVYSWSMVFWYIMSLEPPMGMYTPAMFQERVFQQQYRPAINEKWSPSVGLLMKQCWNHASHKRPNFAAILTKLRSEIKSIDPEVSLIFHESIHSRSTQHRNRETASSQADNSTIESS